MKDFSQMPDHSYELTQNVNLSSRLLSSSGFNAIDTLTTTGI